MAFGTFSMIHPGHADYLRGCKRLGDYLIVVITTDKNVEKEKHRKPVFNQDERKQLVESIKFVDEVVVGDENDFFRIIQEKKPEVVVLGYDSRYDESELEQKLSAHGVSATVHRMERFGNHRTREIIERIKKEF
jgi:FAD synthetase